MYFLAVLQRAYSIRRPGVRQNHWLPAHEPPSPALSTVDGCLRSLSFLRQESDLASSVLQSHCRTVQFFENNVLRRRTTERPEREDRTPALRCASAALGRREDASTVALAVAPPLVRAVGDILTQDNDLAPRLAIIKWVLADAIPWLLLRRVVAAASPEARLRSRRDPVPEPSRYESSTKWWMNVPPSRSSSLP
ncbi:hypothetical protein C8J57DRAFT_1360178 [Mycena rebaudengoi]|nr:hypothetical protein C8J57DRAFT_1360178 [Mycena rebaudengoi]